jgi:hypothetical protein
LLERSRSALEDCERISAACSVSGLEGRLIWRVVQDLKSVLGDLEQELGVRPKRPRTTPVVLDAADAIEAFDEALDARCASL